MRSIFTIKTLAALGLLIFLIGLNAGLVNAQVINQWTAQKSIPDYPNPRPPIMVADQNNIVHMFYDVPLDTLTDIFYYRQWSLAQGWTRPTDFNIVQRTVNSPIQSVYLDESGIFHLVYFGDLQDEGNVYYMYSPAEEVDRATSWSKPVVIGPGAGPVTAATITGDGQGKLIMLYSGQEAGVGLYEVYSTDGGLTWTDPSAVTLIDQKNNWPYSIRTALDSHGQLHAVWSLVNDLGVGTGVYYARLSPDLSEWTSPFLMAKRDPGDYSTQWPELMVNGDQLIVIYQDSFPATKFVRISNDDGFSWTTAIRPFPYDGEYENPVMLRDGDGVIHLILGNRIGDPAVHGMWHSVWLGESWSELVAIVSGPRTSTFDPSSPHAVISQGNVLLVAWRNDVVNAGPAKYSYIVLNAKELPVVPFPTLTPIPITEEPSVTPVYATPVLPLKQIFPSPSGNPGVTRSVDSMAPVLIGIIPVIVVFSALIVFIRLRQNLR